MVQKSQGRKTYRTANGKSIDLDLLIQRNELTPAVGNARVNARGDELGQGGKIVRKREEVLRDYYQSSPGVPNEPSRPRKNESAADQENKILNTLSSQEVNRLNEFDEDWQEDDQGNFVKKGNK
jgi:hypothetical protein